MEGDRARLGRDRGLTVAGGGAALRILLSTAAAQRLGQRIAAVCEGTPPALLLAEQLAPGGDFDVAFMTRDVTGGSTKYQLQPATQHFHDLMRSAPSLRWAQTHSAGADRPVLIDLMQRSVTVTTSSGANAAVVAQSAVAGLLALARHFPQLMAAQRERRWVPLTESDLPRDLSGQTAVIVGWGPVGRQIGAMLSAAGLQCIAVRRNTSPAADGAVETVTYEELGGVLPRADWLVLACPLTDRTRRLIDAAALDRLPKGARLVNVSRGEVVFEVDLISALRDRTLAGAYLDVFEQEPLPAESPLWAMDNVLLTPHAAGHSDGNAERAAVMFLGNLGRWRRGEPLVNVAG